MALAGKPKATVLPCGVAAENRKELFFVKGDMTGLYAEGAGEQVALLDIIDVIGERCIDLLKLNIEGMEFEVLERLLDEKAALSQVRNIQVQFHPVVHNAYVRYQCIREQLLNGGYHLTFDFPLVWENYART